MAASDSTASAQVRIRLSTNDGRYTLSDPAPILVPTAFRRMALSSLVNNLLDHEQSVPFDFIINGSYLRTTLDQFLSEQGISSETIIEAEYTPAQQIPKYIATFPHDDWVSAIDVLPAEKGRTNQTRILSASYDGLLRVWDGSSKVMATSTGKSEGGHSSFIKAAKFISSSQIVSTGFDRVVRLWKYEEAENGLSAAISPRLHLYGHTSSVDSVAVCDRKDGHRMLTGSADHNIGHWTTKISEAPAAPEDLVPKSIREGGKRRKLNPAISVAQRGPLSMLKGHTQQVSGVTFDVQNADVAYSTSWDQTMRTWHLPSASLVDCRSTNQALFSICQLPELNLLAAGTAGRDIKLIDPRASASAVTALILKGHKNAVVSLVGDPSNGHNLASGSHDGTCRIWDLRSTKQGQSGITGQSLYTIHRESLGGKAAPEVASGAQVFALCWDRDLGILSGGADKAIQINRSD
jgi:ribosome biogenesis protein